MKIRLLQRPLVPFPFFRLAICSVQPAHYPGLLTRPIRAVPFTARDHSLELTSTQRRIHATDLCPLNCFGNADWACAITRGRGIRGGCRSFVTIVVNR